MSDENQTVILIMFRYYFISFRISQQDLVSIFPTKQVLVVTVGVTGIDFEISFYNKSSDGFAIKNFVAPLAGCN